MNYYSHHIGDYLSATAHLTLLEHGAYRRLMDVYYIHEHQLPRDKKDIFRLVGARMKEEKEAVDCILVEFFEQTETGWRHGRCEREIALCNKNRSNGAKGGRPPGGGNPKKTQTITTDDNPKETQDKPKSNPGEKPPLPITHHPITQEAEAEICAKQSENQPPLPPLPDSESTSRAKTIATRLCKLDAGGGKKFKVDARDPRVLKWVEAGITDPQLREAYERCMTAKETRRESTPVNPGYLDRFIEEVINESGKKSAVVIKAWYETAPGIEAKGEELGIPPPEAKTGGFPAFKARVFAAAGLSPGAAAA